MKMKEEGGDHSGEIIIPSLQEKAYCPYCGSAATRRMWEERIRRYCHNCNLPLYDNPVPAVCAVVSDREKRLLLVQRKVAPQRGEWCLPGGFMELDETPEAAALRELGEEAGLPGRVEGLIGLKAAPNRIYHTVLVMGYRVTPLGDAICPGDDAMAVRWFPYQQLPPIAFGSHREFITTVIASDFKAGQPTTPEFSRD